MHLNYTLTLIVGHQPALTDQISKLVQSLGSSPVVVDDATAAMARMESEDSAFVAIIVGDDTGAAMNPLQFVEAARTYYGGLIAIVYIGSNNDLLTHEVVCLQEPLNETALLVGICSEVERVDTILEKQ